MPSQRRLQQYAIAISVASIIWNGLEGGLSVGFGAESSSRSLVFFGIQSAIEVISAAIVVWRFLRVAMPGEESGKCLSPRELRFEKYSTIAIGGLLVALALATAATASAGLALHLSPDASTPALVISASALVIMLFIWLPKRYLAKALNSSALQGEAACSLACIQITLVLFVGALAFRVHHAAWWLDGATALVLALLFAVEGGKMLRWACSPTFDGGCCDHRGRAARRKDVEVPAPAQCRDACATCEEKGVSNHSGACRCTVDGQGCSATKEDCCTPRDDEKCDPCDIPAVSPSTTLSAHNSNSGCSAPKVGPTTVECTDGCCTPVADDPAPSPAEPCCVKGCCASKSSAETAAQSQSA